MTYSIWSRRAAIGLLALDDEESQLPGIGDGVQPAPWPRYVRGVRGSSSDALVPAFAILVLPAIGLLACGIEPSSTREERKRVRWGKERVAAVQ